MWFNRLLWSAYLAYHLRGQARFPFQPPETIKRAQARRVRQMVAHAYATVPYYRETMDRLGLRPSDFRGADDLARLPLLEPEQLQRDPPYFVSTAQPLDRHLRLSSSGSSGAPRTVYHDARALFQNAAHGERERSILAMVVGKPLGYRVMSIASPVSSAQAVQQFCRQRGFFPRGAIVRQSIALSEPPEVAVRRINDYRPDIVQSYGSYLEILFAHLQATGEPMHRPKLIKYGSDGLSEAARRVIETRFNIPVFSVYGAAEAFKIGFECQQHRGLHLNRDLYPVRIVDAAGQTLPAGQSGEVIVSNLVNRATVLLNYRLGDMATLLPEPCPCGRSLPLLSFPQGRSNDVIELGSGQLMHPMAVNAVFAAEQEIWQYQVVQQTGTHFSVAIVPSEQCDRRQTQARVAAKLADLFGEDTTVDIAFVAAIERTAAGKFRPVQSLHQRARLGLASTGVGDR